jgi:histidyl-tRNA synthetase
MAITVGPISGFPEWLPELRMAEQDLIHRIRSQYELFGFAPIETPAVERYSVLSAKGGLESQIFTLTRPGIGRGKDADVAPSLREAEETNDTLALHFDLTVPLARYVAQHAERLTFPFRRYQIQKVWRGERAQRGRFREFYQCDIDVIGSGSLDLVHDAEFPVVIAATLEAIGVEDFRVHISNRKILEGLLTAFGVNTGEFADILRLIDGSARVGTAEVEAQLRATGKDKQLTGAVASLLEATTLDEATASLRRVSADCTGVDELRVAMEGASALGLAPDRLRPDFAIARGLDYYTGTVYETFVTGHEAWGSVCSGGRFDDLASYYSKRRFPGVGVSIGLSRLFDLLIQNNFITATQQTPTRVLVTMQDRERFMKSYLALAKTLRSAAIPAEVFLDPVPLREQIAYASSKGIPIAVIAGSREFDFDAVVVRDLRHATQETVTGDGLVRYVQHLLDF